MWEYTRHDTHKQNKHTPLSGQQMMWKSQIGVSRYVKHKYRTAAVLPAFRRNKNCT